MIKASPVCRESLILACLENLWVNDNQISSLDLSQNTQLKFIFVENNVLTSINVSNLNYSGKISRYQ